MKTLSAGPLDATPPKGFPVEEQRHPLDPKNIPLLTAELERYAEHNRHLLRELRAKESEIDVLNHLIGVGAVENARLNTLNEVRHRLAADAIGEAAAPSTVAPQPTTARP